MQIKTAKFITFEGIAYSGGGDDVELAVDWKLNGEIPLLSNKDQAGKSLDAAELFA